MKLEFLEEGSPDCPLIRLYDFDRSTALRLLTIFRALADGSQQHVQLHEQQGVEAIESCQLGLHSGSSDFGIEQTRRNVFECVLTSEGWSEVADLAEPICENWESTDHYQWLNEDGDISLLMSPSGRW